MTTTLISLRSSFLIALLLLVALAAGCAEPQAAAPIILPHSDLPAPSDTPAPSATPTPIDTPQPTATQVPTDTPDPTATPDRAATAAAQSTAQASEAIAAIDSELQKYGLSTRQGFLGWLGSEPEEIVIETYNTMNYVPVAGGQRFSDFVLKVDVTWDSSSGLAGCGVIFRSDDNLEKGEQYRFQTLRLSGLPAWDVELWEFDDWQATVTGKAKVNEAIDQEASAVNTYILNAQGNLLVVYANDIRLGQVSVTRFSDGKIAYMGFQESGKTTCTFSNAWIWALK